MPVRSQGVAVALALVEPAHRVLHRAQHEAEHGQRQQQERQRGGIGEAGDSRAGARSGRQDQVDEPEADGRQDDAEDDRLDQVAMDVMADLVSEDDLDLLRRELIPAACRRAGRGDFVPGRRGRRSPSSSRRSDASR